MRALTRSVAGIVLSAVVACSGTDDGCGPLSGRLQLQGDEDRPAELVVEVADEPDERRRGLMGRTSLGEDGGMVFLFEEPTDGGFWMKDTLIPLSIAFWDEHERIVATLDMQPCREDPCRVYEPGATYVGAVEANLGYFDEHGVEVGDRVELVTDACG